MMVRTARTLTAVSALVLGFGPAVVQAADASSTPYAKYLDCSSSGQRTSCVERGEVMNFAQLREIIAAAMYREEMELRRKKLLPDSDSINRPDSSSTDSSTTMRPGERPSSGNPETSTTDSSTPSSRQPAQPDEETAEGTIAFPPALIPPSLPVVVRYERGIDDQNTVSSRMVFTVKDETGETSSYSVNVPEETGRYIESEIIRTAEPTTRTPVPTTRTPETTTRTVEPIVRTSETRPATAEMEVAAPLDMQEVFVSQEMIPVSTNSEVLVATQNPAPVFSPAQPASRQLPTQTTTTTVQAEIQPAAPAPIRPTVTYLPPAQNTGTEVLTQGASAQTAVPASSPAQPTAAQLPTQTTAQAEMVTVQAEMQPAAPAPIRPTVTYLPPAQIASAQIAIMESSVQYQPVTVSYYTYQTQPVTARYYTFTMQGTTETVTASPVITLELSPAQTNEQTITIRPYVVMISPEEPVHVVPQQVEAPASVLTASGDTSIGVTPGENVRDESYTGATDTPSLGGAPEPSSPSPSPGNDDDDDNDNQGPVD